MNTSLQEAIREAFVIAPAAKVILNTLEIRQAGQTSLFIVQARRSITALDENGVSRVFLPVGFQFSLPPSNEEGNQSLVIAIDNINRAASDFIDLARQSEGIVEIIYRPYLSDDMTTPQMVPPLVLFLKEAQITAAQVTVKATFMDIVNMKFPSEIYSRLRFPALE
jgi:hypothetical protein